MIVEAIVYGVLFVLSLLCLMRTLYNLGYTKGKRDQIYEDAENFLRSVRRHEKNKASNDQ